MHASSFLRPLLSLLLLCATARASRTGLNNVPDTDVSAPHTGVAQLYSNFGEGRETTFLTGIRLGFEPCGQQMELGWDARWEPGDASAAFFSGKWRMALDDRGDALAIGFANAAPFSHHRELTGQPQLYLAGTAHLGFVRLHAGGMLQAGNDALFAGLDHTFDVWGTKLKFRADITTTNDRRDWMASAGFTWRVHKHWNVECWESFPSAENLHHYTTAKVGYHFDF
jgi:hypothetical protein